MYTAWLDYDWDVDYSLTMKSDKNSPAHSGCYQTETSGTGTTDLVIARLTDREPVVTRYRLYSGYVPERVNGAVVMTSRGDLLVVSVAFTVGMVPTLKYLEIDSTRLP